MTQKWGLPDTQGALPSQTGSTTPASALLCGLSSTGRGVVGQQGNRLSPRPPPRDPEEQLGERGNPLHLLRLHLEQHLRPPQPLLQLLYQLQALLQLAVLILYLQRESRGSNRPRGVATVALSKLRQNLNVRVYWIRSVFEAASG